MATENAAKRAAGEKAVEYVTDDMVVGLGTGSTVYYFLVKLGERCRAGLKILGVPTSLATERIAREQGIPLADSWAAVDVVVDGADEIDPHLDLIKGMGGALLREKIVAQAAGRMVVIGDEGKLVKRLGTQTPLPVEVLPFGWEATALRLRQLGLAPVLRRQGSEPVLTDNGNYLLECHAGVIDQPRDLAAALEEIAGVVGHGLFLGLATTAVIGSESGVRIIQRPPSLNRGTNP
ncbi:MAG: ribose-5-phosphate isomerase RpiA [Armatimonadetes bacterium]|jgi:ribose 5-phosphate isomerase A|nr:ribose-5-phosphate isomerase RpiA [Armatimonadota bacterium]